jgi:hypothetical protein
MVVVATVGPIRSDEPATLRGMSGLFELREEVWA